MPELKQVSKAFAEKIILRDFSHAFAPGRVTCLMGPSGSGKTTLLRVAAGLLAPDSGQVDCPAKRSSFVFQEDRLLPWRTALQNLTALSIPETDARSALDAVLLHAESDTFPGNMSGGMQRRLAIARAIAFGGGCFFLDEPLRGLDDATAAPVLEALRVAIQGRTALLITHRPEEALALADIVLYLDGPPVRIIRAAETAAFPTADALKGWLTCDSP